MNSGRCYECVYAGTSPARVMQTFSPGFGLTYTCVNSLHAPGRMVDVHPGGTCRNFHPRHRQPPARIEPPQPPDDGVRYIALTQGQFAIVDATDYEWLNKYRWCASKHAGKYYARRFTTKGTIWMHREIMQTPPGMVVDHISGNSLDNRRGNMRNCKPHQNAYNKPPRGRTSKFKGVYPHGDRWEARIKHKGRRYHLGLFATELEAAKARDAKARELEGEYAYINVPSDAEDGGQITEDRKPPAPKGQAPPDATPASEAEGSPGRYIVRTPIWPTPQTKAKGGKDCTPVGVQSDPQQLPILILAGQ